VAANEKQIEAWNDGEWVHYVDNADRYDSQLSPSTDMLLERVRLVEPMATGRSDDIGR